MGRAPVVHPVYLDVPMMVSFLASLHGGVTFEDEQIRRSLSEAQREREASVKAKVPSFLSMLGLDLSGRMARRQRDEDAEEVKAIRQHTAASLFNSLLAALRVEGGLTEVRERADLESVSAGDLVSVTGPFIGNPLEALLAFYGLALPYFAMQQAIASVESDDRTGTEGVSVSDKLAQELESTRAQLRTARRSGNPAVQAQQADLEVDVARLEDELQEAQAAEGLEQLAAQTEDPEQRFGLLMLSQMREDLKRAPVHDTVIETQELRAVLTMSAEFFTEQTNEYLRAGEFTAIGKVTRVLGEDDTLNLLRRTVLGAAGPEIARDVVNSFKADEIELETFDPILGPPAVQILPLAVYV